jgi:DNA-directed RNA polymerase subunit RPC12/RpoP
MEKSTFQKIATFQYSSEAMIFKGKLESEGIEAFLRDNNTVDANPMYSNAIGGVKLYVKNDDFIKATHILSGISQYSLDENNELIKCPKCDAKQVDMVTSITDIKSLLLFILVLLPFHFKHKYKCEKCNFEFSKA